MDKIEVLGVSINKVTLSDVLKYIQSFIQDRKSHYIVTTNSEFILTAQKDQGFKNVLNTADLSVPDGYGVLFATKFQSELKGLRRGLLFPLMSLFVLVKVYVLGVLFRSYLDEIVTGADLFLKIIQGKDLPGVSIYLLGTEYIGGSSSGQTSLNILKNRYANVNFVGACSGRKEVEKGRFTFIDSSEVIERVTRDVSAAGLKKVDLLFVAFGHQRQEMWISQNLSELPVSVAIGVGGAFDFITGRQKRAPKIVRNLTLEWLFRLLTEPSPERVRRVLSAAFYFPVLLFINTIRQNRKSMY